MVKKYVKPDIRIYLGLDKDVILTSGDGYEDDPWADGFGGESWEL